MTTKHRIPRTLFVHDNFPPFVGGSVTMMYNLSLGLDLSESYAITQLPEGLTLGAGNDNSVSIDMPKKGLKGISKKWAKGSRFGLPSFFIMIQIPKIVSEAIKASKKTNPEVVMTTYPGHHFTIAGWLTARRLKLPLVVYYHSLWVETRKRRLERIMAKVFEYFICKGAEKVLVATPPTSEYLNGKLSIESGVIEHTLDSRIWPLDEKPVRVKSMPKNILMLGGINKFNQDSVIAFSKAVARNPNIKFKILTAQSIEDLKRIGVDCTQVTAQFCSREQLKATILEADTLYMALGFKTPVQTEVEVVIPTRMMDYIATGIPIIAHGPANTWTLQEAKNRGWGFCINSLDVTTVEASLTEFLEMPDYNTLVQSAWNEANRRDYKKISGLLAHYLSQASGKIK